MNDTPLFDYVESERRKKIGMGKSASPSHRKALLGIARDIAVNYAIRNYGFCTADDVARLMQEKGYNYSDLGNAAGSIFKGNDWNFTGQYVKSNKVSAHRRDIKVWELKEEPPC